MSELVADVGVVAPRIAPAVERVARTAHRYLVLGRTEIDSPEVAWLLRSRVAATGTEFHLVVPVSPVGRAHEAMIRSEHLGRWPEEPGYALARFVLTRATYRLRGFGLSVTGEVGPPDPFQAVRESLGRRHFDEILIPELSARRIRRRSSTLVRRLQRSFEVEVSTLVLTSG